MNSSAPTLANASQHRGSAMVQTIAETNPMNRTALVRLLCCFCKLIFVQWGLPVPVQVIAWKDSLTKQPIMYRVRCTQSLMIAVDLLFQGDDIDSGDQVLKAAVSEDEDILSDEDDIESEDESMDAVMVTNVSDKDLESKSTDADGTFNIVVVVIGVVIVVVFVREFVVYRRYSYLR